MLDRKNMVDISDSPHGGNIMSSGAAMRFYMRSVNCIVFASRLWLCNDTYIIHCGKYIALSRNSAQKRIKNVDTSTFLSWTVSRCLSSTVPIPKARQLLDAPQ